MTIQSISQTTTLSGVEPREAPQDVSSDGGIDACGALLPAPLPLFGGDVGAEMALLSIRAGRDEEQINVEAQQTQDQAQQVADQNEVNEMHQEASDIRSNAIESGLLQIAEGATQIAGAAASASAQAGAGSDAVQQSVGAASAQSTLSAYSGAATLLGAASTTVAGFGKAGQTDDEAQIASYKAAADRAQQMSSEATQGQTDAKSIISNAIQFYQEYEQTKSQIEAAALYKA